MWTKAFKAVVEALKESPKKRKEVIAEAGKKGHKGSEKTIDRILEALKEAELISEEKNGMYRWIKEYEVIKFENTKQHEQKLKHSESLVRIVKRNLGREAILYNKNFQYFREHLKGYPDVGKLYEEWENVYHDVKAARKKFNEEIRRNISEEGFEIVEYHHLKEDRSQVTPEFFNIVEENLRLDTQGVRKPIKLEVKDAAIGIEGETICKNRNMLEELQKLLENCTHPESVVKNFYEQLTNIKNEELRLYSELIGKINYLVMTVLEDSIPLKGSCERCKIVIEIAKNTP